MAPFANMERFHKPMNAISVFNMVATLGVVIAIDVLGLATLSWGNQLYITMIETLLLALFLIGLTIIEFKSSKHLDAGFRKLDNYGDSSMAPFMDSPKRRREDEMEKKLRQDALKGIIAAIRGNKSFFNPDSIEGVLNEDGNRRMRSLPAEGNELEELSESARSFPLSPKEKKIYENPLLMNNLEDFKELGSTLPAAEFQPDNVYAEAKSPSQLKPVRKGRMVDSQTFNSGAAGLYMQGKEEETRGGRKKKGRGRREYRLHESAKFDDESGDDLEVIPEEKVEHEVIGGVDVPPDNDKRTFNENDVFGEFERNVKGSVSLIVNDRGAWVDRLGKRVNEKGYRINQKGDVVDTVSGKLMFRKGELDEKGELPAPYSLERFNLNPHDVRGDLDRNRHGELVFHKTKKGQIVDKQGRLVNEQGLLVDEKGNLKDKHGRTKLTSKQLYRSGAIPKAYNMEGKKYDVNSVCGEFKKDNAGNIIIEKNRDGLLTDRKGRLVNAKGYLLDEEGNVTDRRGNVVFEKRHLSGDGEFPKIFPFSKFKIDSIMGNLVYDDLGNVILKKNRYGDFVDADGFMVNAKGYLVDEHENVIDKNGNLVFKAASLEEDGEIPRVFRSGLLRCDTNASLEKGDTAESIGSGPDDEALIQNELQNLEEEKRTSVDKVAHFDEEEKPLDVLAPKQSVSGAAGAPEKKSPARTVLAKSPGRRSPGKNSPPLKSPKAKSPSKASLPKASPGRPSPRDPSAAGGAPTAGPSAGLPSPGRPSAGQTPGKASGKISALDMAAAAAATGGLAASLGASGRSIGKLSKETKSKASGASPRSPLDHHNAVVNEELAAAREDDAHTSVESLMEDTPSNYNIANQRYDTDPDKYKRKPTDEVEEEDEQLEEDPLEQAKRSVPYEEDE